MSFLSPWRLLLLIVVVALGITYAMFQKRRSKYAVRFTNLALLESVAPNRPGWRRHIAAAVQLVALAALVLAFAQPVHDVKVPRERATVMLALDVSLSMEATDVKPSRIEAAKAAATAFLDDVPKQFNVGLVTFAGSSKIRVAPTTDRQQVANAIQNAPLADGTAIGDAINSSLDALGDVPPAPDGAAVPAAIVLLSDGTTTMGTANATATKRASDEGVPVSTIAFGTATGTVTLPNGQSVSVPVDAPALKTIAQETGGNSYEATTQNQLTDVYSKIGSSIGFDDGQSSLTQWFIAASFLTLAIASGLALAWSNRLP
ncbi:MAG: VWA domain-containing protein [Actinobacteria bacterium]|nr:VWA domain-containing protein [Actinomycetota bacterium]MSW32174.1 VWA domain-containing protein [Actinomycetota bacterium]MSX33902.1 VWA domain-containing protein [Actinomycetota bacterium]MSX96015.1 VWA domain-containing protein [Actinomycetota bacterium]MSY24460.1 VWA domain-containing protein [Actinomycetota bacterium]